MLRITIASCLGLLLLAACGREEPGELPTGDEAGLALAGSLREHYGASEHIDAELRIRVVVPNEDFPAFRIQIEAHPEVGVVLDAFEKGAEVFDGHLDTEGHAVLVFTRPREEVVAGELATAADRLPDAAQRTALSTLIARLPTIIDEVRVGPVPVADAYRIERTEAEAVHLRCIHSDGSQSLLELDPALERVDAKTILLPREAIMDDANESEPALSDLLRIEYSYHLAKDSLLRARLMTVTLADDPTIIYIKLADWVVPSSLEQPPTPPEVPDDRPHYRLDEWLRAITTEATDGEAMIR